METEWFQNRIAELNEENQKLEVRVDELMRIIAKKDDYILSLVMKLDSIQEGE
jgi:hypothetical protein